MWARGTVYLYPLSLDFKKTGLTDKIRDLATGVKPLTKLTVTGSSWGPKYQPITLQMKTEDGIEGHFMIDSAYRISTRFHNETRGATEWRPTIDLILEDPQKLFGCWTNEIWTAVRNGAVIVGMDRTMVDAACWPAWISRIVSAPDGTVNVVECSYRRGKQRTLLMKNGKVTDIAR